MRKVWWWGLSLGLVILLGGCGVQPQEPVAVLSKMTKNISKTEKVEFAGSFQIVGSSTLPLLQGLQDLKISGTGKVNLADVKNLKYLLDVVISGASSEGSTEVGAELRNFPDYSYFKVTKITVPLGLPFSLSADNKWYKIKSSGGNQDWLGSTKPLTNDQIQQMRDLIAQSKLFDVVQKFPDETIGGIRAYHFQVAVNKDELLTLLSSWSKVSNQLDNADWGKWSAMLSDYKYELWINKSDSRLTKADVKGWYDGTNNQRTNFTFSVNFNKFNTAVSIERPTNVQEFNLRELLGLPANTQ